MAGTEPTRNGKPKRPATTTRTARATKAAPVDPVDETIAEPEPTTSPRAGKKRGPYNVPHIEKIPFTVRLTPDVIAHIKQARNEAAAQGQRLTNDDAIMMAVRAFWGKKRQRKPGA